MPQPEIHPAFVLHTRSYRETSKIVDLFVPETGRISVVARGANRAKSSFGATLQPFLPLLVSYAGRTELKNLKSCELNGAPLRLQGKALFSGIYLNELIARTVQTQYHCEELFAHYQLALSELAGGAAIEPVLRRFELILLEELGYAIPFPESITDQSSNPETLYFYHQNGHFEETTLQMENETRCYAAADLTAIASGSFESPATLRSAKRLARQAFASLLGEKPLRSRELFRNYQKENL